MAAFLEKKKEVKTHSRAIWHLRRNSRIGQTVTGEGPTALGKECGPVARMWPLLIS